jgi:non-heme chloroperoxidase
MLTSRPDHFLNRTLLAGIRICHGHRGGSPGVPRRKVRGFPLFRTGRRRPSVEHIGEPIAESTSGKGGAGMTAVEVQDSGTRMITHTVTGGGGLRLHVREWGKPDGPPILFLHGWSQSHQCWDKQVSGPLREEFRLVACDLRGHGMSQAPDGPECYTDAGLWAADVAAIIEQLRLDRPVLVGWSYGAFVICDYLRACGQEQVAAACFSGGAVKLGEAAFGTLIGPGFLSHFPGATAGDLPANIAAMRGLVRAFTVEPLPAADTETLLCAGMVVPAGIRASLAAREIDGDDVLRTLEVPLLVAHGRADTIVLPAMAEHVLAICPAAEASWYPGAHAPHLEDPERFNRELAALTRRGSTAAHDG